MVAAGATLDSLIPPSAIMVVYAIIVEASIGKLLVAGFIPGFISAICYSIIVVIWSMWKPDAGRPIRGYTWGERFASLPGTLPVTGSHLDHLRVDAVRLGDADGGRRARRLRGLRRRPPQPHEVDASSTTR